MLFNFTSLNSSDSDISGNPEQSNFVNQNSNYKSIPVDMIFDDDKYITLS